MTQTNATFGIYRSKKEVDATLSLLNGLGLEDARTSVLYPRRQGAQDFPNVQKSEIAKFGRVGSVIGSGLFVLFAILAVSGALSFVHAEHFNSTERVFAVLGGLFLGAMIGAACGILVGIGTPESAGRRYGQYVDAGGILLSAHSDGPDAQTRFEEIFEKSGAQDIVSTDENKAWQDVMAETAELDRVILSPVPGQSSRPFSMFEDSTGVVSPLKTSEVDQPIS